MAYGRRRTSRYRRGYRSGGNRSRRAYGRRYTASRRSTRRRSGGRTARVVIQVVGGAGGVAASPFALGQKAALPVRARY